MSQIEVRDSWRTALEPDDVRIRLHEVAGVRRMRVTSTADGLRTEGGHRIAYRLIGSRSRNYARWMPWFADITVAAADPHGSVVGLRLASDQGHYAYQGEPTRQKWRALLDDLASEFRRASQASGIKNH